MAIVIVGKHTNNRILEYQGESTDTKPTLNQINNGSTFLEVDTKNVYVWHINQWRQL